MEKDRNYVIKLLHSCKPEQIRITEKTSHKIQHVHGVKLEEVKSKLLDLEHLESVEEQPARHESQRTFQLIFKKSSKKRLFVVITENTESGTIFLVTAFETSKKLEKLIKRGKIRRL
ncbi:MAG: hypothetical protein HYU56_03290 [Candidatus Aenigmarchaeota archaeon]|nr:hypothetical protein [Candidatus Aenigmarchaeota archaeon]